MRFALRISARHAANAAWASAPQRLCDAYRGIRLRNLLSGDAAITTFQQRDHASVFEPKARMRGWKQSEHPPILLLLLIRRSRTKTRDEKLSALARPGEWE
jgi:hypothetical protein